MTLTSSSKKAEGTFSISFGLIFAIILIVIFVIVAINVGKNFFDVGNCAKVGEFHKDLQDELDKLVLVSQSGDLFFEIDLPKGVKTVCFSDSNGTVTYRGEEYDEIKQFIYADSNIHLYPQSEGCDMSHKNLNYINISEMTKESNPYCVPANSVLKLSKGFSDYNAVISVKDEGL